MTSAASTAIDTQQLADHAVEAEAFIGSILDAAEGAFKIFSIYLGHKLGYYNTLAGNDALTSSELSELTRTHERYAREWLEQQAVAGVLRVDDKDAGAHDRRYSLPAGHAEVLTEADSLNYLAPLPQLIAGVTRPLHQLPDLYRSGGGLKFGAYGPDCRQAQAAMNRATFLKSLGREWVRAMPDVHEKMSKAGHRARVADFGCGCGWSSIGLALAYPDVQIDGYDTDAASIDEARENAADYGVADRITFHHADAVEAANGKTYDMVMICETLHDMGDPVGALRSARRLVAEDAVVLVVDERVADRFDPEAGQIERIMYGWSILHCLPAGMADGAMGCCGGTGTVMRTGTVKRYAQEAGFTGCDVLPVDNLFFRLYRINP